MRLLIAGGGTGGHLYPGIAVAEELLARDAAHRILFAGTDRGLEARVLPPLGLPFVTIRAAGLVGSGLRGALRGALKLAAGARDALGVLRRFRPDVCLGVGGYVSFPVVALAALRGIPCAVQEQNAWPGLANRVLGRLVRRVYLGDASAAAHFPAAKVQVTGNPLRRRFTAAPAYQPPAPGTALRVLVLGGSQGARVLNETLPEALALLDGPWEVWHQAGRGVQQVRARYPATARTRVVAFIDAIDEAYRWAHLVIARAGALTVAELAAAGRPALLVPFAHAAGGHQEANARAAASRGAALCLVEAELDAARLAHQVQMLRGAPDRLAAMAEAAAASAPRDAAASIVDDLIGLDRGHSGGEAGVS